MYTIIDIHTLNHLYIIFEMIVGFLSWVYLWDVYHYWYTCVKPSLYDWEEATLIMMNDLFDVFLTSAFKHFTENVCICFHQEDLPVIVCVFVCVPCTCMFRCMCIYVHWHVGAQCQCHVSFIDHSPPLFFETESFTELETPQFSSAGSAPLPTRLEL